MFQQLYQRIEKSLNEMSEQAVKLSYDNRLLRATVTQLHTQLESVPAVLADLARLRKSSLATEAKYAKVLTRFAELYKYVWCESRCLQHVTLSEMSDDKQHLSYDGCLEVRGEIIRAVLCCIVYWSCAQSYAHLMSSSYISLDCVLSHWAHFTVRRFICVYFCVFCVFLFHTAYVLYYCEHGGLALIGLKSNP